MQGKQPDTAVGGGIPRDDAFMDKIITADIQGMIHGRLVIFTGIVKLIHKIYHEGSCRRRIGTPGRNWVNVLQITPFIKAEILLAAIYQNVLFMFCRSSQKFRQNFRLDGKVEGHKYFILIGADVTRSIHDQQVVGFINESNPFLIRNRFFLKDGMELTNSLMLSLGSSITSTHGTP
jgi:hypothetical protein